MNSKQRIIVLFILVISLLIPACGPGQLWGPTLTPTFTATPTFTPTATPIPAPRPGHWEGTAENDWVKELTFVVTADNEITDFRVTLNTGFNNCTEGFRNIPLTEDYSFQSEKILTDREGFFVQAEGRFTGSSTASGTIFGFCSTFKVDENGNILPLDIPWDAKWVHK